MCKWGTTTPVMVLRPADLSCTGLAVAQSVPVDSCIASIVEALAAAGIGTRGSCCGHYNRDGVGKIELDDGRDLLIIAPRKVGH